MISFRKAEPKDLAKIMKIIQEARVFIGKTGSDQWQGTYPAASDIEADFAKNQGYVLLVDAEIAGYCAIIAGEDPAYTKIKNGAWTNQSLDYLAIHRIALSDKFRGQGLTKALWEEVFKTGLALGYRDFRVDTSPENAVMRHVISRAGFEERGHVDINGDRVAYQKELL